MPNVKLFGYKEYSSMLMQYVTIAKKKKIDVKVLNACCDDQKTKNYIHV